MHAVPLVNWNISPELLELGPFTVRWYGLFFALGFFFGYALIRRVFIREDKPQEDLDRLLLYVLAATVVGARLGHCLFYDPAYYLSHPVEILEVWKGGLASHGGAIGILVGLCLYARSRPTQPCMWLLDRIAVPTALAACFIRLGNLFNSEIIGEPTEVPWAFVFARVDNQPRHPAQLYESIAYALIFVVLLSVYRKFGASTPRGLLLGLFLVKVFSARFLIEFVKVRQAAYGGALPLSVGQLLSIPAIIIGIGLLIHAAKQKRAV